MNQIEGMTAAEVIRALQQVGPETRVTIATAEGSSAPVGDVRTMGYSGGFAVIVAID